MITAAQAGNTNATATWVGAVCPGALDDVDIAGFAIVQAGGPLEYASLVDGLGGGTFEITDDFACDDVQVPLSCTTVKTGSIPILLDVSVYVSGSNALTNSGLVSGTVTIANATVTANTRIFVSRRSKELSTAMGFLEATAFPASSNFVITALKADAATETNDVSFIGGFTQPSRNQNNANGIKRNGSGSCHLSPPDTRRTGSRAPTSS